MTTYRCGIANLYVKSEPRPMARWLENFADDHDILFLQEVSLRHRRHIQWRLDDDWWIRGPLDRLDGVAIVMGRRTLLPDPVGFQTQAGTGWWGHKAGRQHEPRILPLVYSNDILLGSIHAPPGVDFVDGVPKGPEDRVRAYRTYMRDVRRAVEAQIEKHNPKAILLAGDWNEDLFARGKRSPDWLASKLGLDGRNLQNIDYPLGRGGRVSYANPRPKGPGADHYPRTFTFEVRG